MVRFPDEILANILAYNDFSKQRRAVTYIINTYKTWKLWNSLRLAQPAHWASEEWGGRYAGYRYA
jgi:hypothetical protein